MPVDIIPVTVPATEQAVFGTFWMSAIMGNQKDPNGVYPCRAIVNRVSVDGQGNLIKPTEAQIAIAKEHGVKLQGTLVGDLYEIAARRAQNGKPGLAQAITLLAQELCDEAVAQGVL